MQFVCGAPEASPKPSALGRQLSLETLSREDLLDPESQVEL
jgi:hypothetical protein